VIDGKLKRELSDISGCLIDEISADDHHLGCLVNSPTGFASPLQTGALNQMNT